MQLGRVVSKAKPINTNPGIKVDQEFKGGSITRGLLRFCVIYARIIKVYSLINKILFKCQKGINSLKICTNHSQCFIY